MTQLFPTDWAAAWQTQVIAEHAQFDEITDPQARPSSDWWSAHAARFHEYTQRAPQPDAFLARVLPHIYPGVRVLDIGAGTGRYAVPLARAGAQVTAVEPSPGMCSYLEQASDFENLAIRVVPSPWEEADVPPAEIVICAHVLYAVRDAASFLRKLDRSTLGQCFICLGYDSPNAWLAPFWRSIYGVERLLLPGAVPALALLHQLGVDAQLTPIAPTSTWRFENPEDALEDVCAWLCLLPDAARDAQLRALLREQLYAHPDGGWQVSHPAHMAVLSWDK